MSRNKSALKTVAIVFVGAFFILALTPFVKNLTGGTTSQKNSSTSSGGGSGGSSVTAEEVIYITADESCLTSGFGEMHNSKQLSYLKDSYENISSYASGNDGLDVPEKLTLKWNDTNKSTLGNYIVQLGTDSTFNSCKTYQTTSTSLSVTNLRVKSVYYWRVAESGTSLDKAKTYSFTTSNYAPRVIDIGGCLNVRDVGGWTTTSGREIKQEKLYRGARLNMTGATEFAMELTTDGLAAFKSLGIKTIIDLRKTEELGGATETIMTAEYGVTSYYSLPMTHTTDNYLTENTDKIKSVFVLLSDENNYPIYYNCNIGTDRTGVVSYLLGALLGMSQDDLRRDYLWSNFAAIGKSPSVGGLTYESTIEAADGDTLADKAKNLLISYGVTEAQINSIKDILL